MATIHFDDFGIQIGRGTAGTFSGHFEYDEAIESIEEIWLDTWIGTKRITERFPETHPLFDRFRDELEIAYTEEISSAINAWRTDRDIDLDDNAEHRLRKRDFI